jgi:hypothetical protein
VGPNWGFMQATVHRHTMLLASTAFACAFGLAVAMVGCTKPVDEPVIVVDTIRPPILQPSGLIKEFIALDTLIAFLKGSTTRWNVTETNTKTLVFLDSVQVANYGSAQTGPLRQTTSFLLTVNNGKRATTIVNVADSLTTMFWNEGKRWRVVDALSFETQTVSGLPVRDWFSHFTDKLANERVSFNLDGTSKEVNISPNYPQPKASGKFAATYYPLGSPYKVSLSWKGRLYLVDTLTDTKLTMTFDTVYSPGLNVTNRVRYKAEY